MSEQPLTAAKPKPNRLEVMFEERTFAAPENRYRGIVYDRDGDEVLFICETPKASRTRKWVYRFVTENTDFERIQ